MVAVRIGRHCARERLSSEINQECLETEKSEVNRDTHLDNKGKIFIIRTINKLGHILQLF